MENIKKAFLSSEGKVPELLILYEKTDSTNERAKRMTERPCECESLSLFGIKGTSLIVADAQDAGRGRLGRSFASPAGAGLYMSLTVKLKVPLSEAFYITPLTAVVCARVIERLTGADIKIKWVNDLYLNGKKLAGILTEVISSDPDSCTLVIGIGVNLKRSSLPAEVAKVATSLEAEGFACDRGRLAAALTDALLSAVFNKPSRDIPSDYRERSCLIGERVTVTTPTCSYEAKVLDIEDDFSLVIATGAGEIKRLVSGDVQRVRKMF